MRFDEDAQLDTSQIDDKRGRRLKRGGLAIGGGGGLIGAVLLIVMALAGGGGDSSGLSAQLDQLLNQSTGGTSGAEAL